MTGILYGLGVGPGDPELLTIKALRVLRSVPVIAYPAPLEGDSLTRAIVANHLPGGQEEIVIRTPTVEARFPAEEVYERASREIADRLDVGADVAVLCEGDPFFYGSFLYLFARMACRYRVEVVPGVSSLMACPAALGAALAARDDVLTVLPATISEGRLVAQLRETDAAAIIKVGRHFAKVRRVLERLGLAGEARYIERATMAEQRILPLAAADPASVPYFSMILVHRRGDAWRS